MRLIAGKMEKIFIRIHLAIMKAIQTEKGIAHNKEGKAGGKSLILISLFKPIASAG